MAALLLLFFNHPATTPIYTLSLHDALPISRRWSSGAKDRSSTSARSKAFAGTRPTRSTADRKSTRLNSSHITISYAVFCLKKKNQTMANTGNRDKDVTNRWHL